MYSKSKTPAVIVTPIKPIKAEKSFVNPSKETSINALLVILVSNKIKGMKRGIVSNHRRNRGKPDSAEYQNRKKRDPGNDGYIYQEYVNSKGTNIYKQAKYSVKKKFS